VRRLSEPKVEAVLGNVRSTVLALLQQALKRGEWPGKPQSQASTTQVHAIRIPFAPYSCGHSIESSHASQTKRCWLRSHACCRKRCYVTDVAHRSPERGGRVRTRQQVLVLYLALPQLDSRVVGWSFYDGASQQDREAHGVEVEPPYSSGLEALRDGWRLIEYPRLENPAPGREYQVGYLQAEFVFEKIIDSSAPLPVAEGESV